MKPHQGKQLKTSEINIIIEEAQIPANESQYMQPSDHCDNHMNKGACACAFNKEGSAIFRQLEKGLYYVIKLE